MNESEEVIPRLNLVKYERTLQLHNAFFAAPGSRRFKKADVAMAVPNTLREDEKNMMKNMVI